MKALKLTLSVIAAALFISCGSPKSSIVKASEDVIFNAIGTLDGITLQEIPSEGGKDCYEICAQNCAHTYLIENFEDIPQNINYKNKKR